MAKSRVKNKYTRNLHYWHRKPDADGNYSRIPDDTDVRCNRCLKTKKAVDFYSASWCKNGLRSYCKKCYIHYIKGYQYDGWHSTKKQCERCKQVKRGYYFYADKTTKSGLSLFCKSCIE